MAEVNPGYARQQLMAEMTLCQYKLENPQLSPKERKAAQRRELEIKRELYG